MSSTPESFAELGLSDSLLKTLAEIGYETPSPIQAIAHGVIAAAVAPDNTRATRNS